MIATNSEVVSLGCEGDNRVKHVERQAHLYDPDGDIDKVRKQANVVPEV